MKSIQDCVDEIKDHVSNFEPAKDITIWCRQSFFDKLINHWRIKLLCQIKQKFSNEFVLVCMAPRNRWKLIGKTSGKTMFVKRSVKVTAEMDPVFTVET